MPDGRRIVFGSYRGGGALNPPNIAAIYGIEESNGVTALD